MSKERNKAIVQRYFEARTNGDLDAVDEIFASSFVRHTPSGSKLGVPEDQKRVIREWRMAFPDYRDTIISLVAENDLVVAHVLFSGTHTGMFEYTLKGLGPWSPTGKSIQMWEMFVYRLKSGKIVEVSSLWDRLELIDALGVSPGE